MLGFAQTCPIGYRRRICGDRLQLEAGLRSGSLLQHDGDTDSVRIGIVRLGLLSHCRLLRHFCGDGAVVYLTDVQSAAVCRLGGGNQPCAKGQDQSMDRSRVIRFFFIFSFIPFIMRYDRMCAQICAYCILTYAQLFFQLYIFLKKWRGIPFIFRRMKGIAKIDGAVL